MYNDNAMTPISKGEYKTANATRYITTLDGTVAVVAKGKGMAVVDTEDFTWIRTWLRDNDTITIIPDAVNTDALIAFIGTIIPRYRITVYDTPKQAKFRSVLFGEGIYSVMESDVGADIVIRSIPLYRNEQCKLN